MAVSIPSQAIQWAKAADTELWPVLVALAKYESGFDPNAVGDSGCSKGLLQMNTCGGLGNGHADTELFDPVANFRLGAQYVRAEMAGGKDLYEALWPWSVRPSAWSLLQQMCSEGVNGESITCPIDGVLASGGKSGFLVLAAIGLGLFILLR